MPRRSQAAVWQQVKRLQHQSTEQLFLSLSRQAFRRARLNEVVRKKAKSGGYSGPRKGSDRKEFRVYRKSANGGIFSKSHPEATTIDLSMLRNLRAALLGEVSAENGEEIFNTVWERLRRKVCDDWNLCDKLKIADAGLSLKLINFLIKGAPPSQHQMIAAVVVLAFRMGPNWMCDCGGKRKLKK